ncbi:MULTISPECIES: IS3 family transposase [unclassified Kitasatospora]|uniref:IS3 family transposase n=1 Tax=unclassified Kitasatospora TaxID=2633591 RepID=UPI00382F14F2
MHAALRREVTHVGRKRVEHLMRQACLQGVSPRRPPLLHPPRPRTTSPRTWSSAISPPTPRTGCRSPTSRSSPPARAPGGGPRSATPSPAGSWASTPPSTRTSPWPSSPGLRLPGREAHPPQRPRLPSTCPSSHNPPAEGRNLPGYRRPRHRLPADPRLHGFHGSRRLCIRAVRDAPEPVSEVAADHDDGRRRTNSERQSFTSRQSGRALRRFGPAVYERPGREGPGNDKGSDQVKGYVQEAPRVRSPPPRRDALAAGSGETD